MALWRLDFFFLFLDSFVDLRWWLPQLSGLSLRPNLFLCSHLLLRAHLLLCPHLLVCALRLLRLQKTVHDFFSAVLDLRQGVVQVYLDKFRHLLCTAHVRRVGAARSESFWRMKHGKGFAVGACVIQ